MSRAYPHRCIGGDPINWYCRCGRPPAEYTADVAREGFGSDCPAAMREHIAELERECTTAHEAGRRAMCVQAGGYPDSDLDEWAEANRRMGDALDEALRRTVNSTNAVLILALQWALGEGPDPGAWPGALPVDADADVSAVLRSPTDADAADRARGTDIDPLACRRHWAARRVLVEVTRGR